MACSKEALHAVLDVPLASRQEQCCFDQLHVERHTISKKHAACIESSAGVYFFPKDYCTLRRLISWVHISGSEWLLHGWSITSQYEQIFHYILTAMDHHECWLVGWLVMVVNQRQGFHRVRPGRQVSSDRGDGPTHKAIRSLTWMGPRGETTLTGWCTNGNRKLRLV